MWLVVYVAPNRDTAEYLKNILLDEGLLVTLRELGLDTKRNTVDSSTKQHAVEMIVPVSEAEEAHEIINEALKGIKR